MIKQPKIFLQHILDSIEKIEFHTQGQTKKSFLENYTIQDAVIRRFEVIGEASKNIPSSFKNEHRQIPWAQISAMRNILIHEYFNTSLNIIWATIKIDLPKLKKSINKLLSQIE